MLDFVHAWALYVASAVVSEGVRYVCRASAKHIPLHVDEVRALRCLGFVCSVCTAHTELAARICRPMLLSLSCSSSSAFSCSKILSTRNISTKRMRLVLSMS